MKRSAHRRGKSSRFLFHDMINKNLLPRLRMEETFLRVKTERDDLLKRYNRDSTDGKMTTTTTTGVTEEIANLKTELKRQKSHYEAQFIEYVRVIFFCNYGLVSHALLAATIELTFL